MKGRHLRTVRPHENNVPTFFLETILECPIHPLAKIPISLLDVLSFPPEPVLHLRRRPSFKANL
jgi:hypothetical protein